MSDAIKMLASILLRAQGTIDAETGKEIDVGYEVTRLKDEFWRLNSDNKAMRAALEMIATADIEGVCDNGYGAAYVARMALGDKQ